MAVPVQDEGDRLARAWEQVDVPEGYRVEIVEGSILVSPTPSARHVKVVWCLEGVLRAAAPPASAAVQMLTIDLPATGERYVPDLVVVPAELLDGPGWTRPAASVLLAVEVTSPSGPRVDRVTKLRGYAMAGVARYLLVDVADRTVTLFTEPHDGAYRSHVQVPFGKTIELPEPFDGAIDTAAFD